MKTTHNGFDFSMVTLSTTAFSNAVFKSRVLYWGVQKQCALQPCILLHKIMKPNLGHSVRGSMLHSLGRSHRSPPSLPSHRSPTSLPFL